MIVATVIVLVAASLLVTIWLTARSIYAHALRALAAAEKIRVNTLPIWELQTTNEVAGRMVETVQALEAKGGTLVQAVSHTAVGRPSTGA
jgi:exo-beta-1,3-glucanase (GH17 family)